MKLFVTAAIGNPQLIAPAQRLVSQVQLTKLFDSHIIVTEAMLSDICPEIFEWYSEADLLKSKGFGFYMWKSAIAEAAMNGHWGVASHVFYLDAGCEVLPGKRTQRIISGLLEKAKDCGVVYFSAGGVEWKYTKPELFDYFPSVSELKYSPQAQAGTWVLSGDIGLQIAMQWNRLVKQSPAITDNSIRYLPDGFISPRHDQSVFSLTVKSRGILAEPILTPYPNKRFASRIKSLRYPIWTSRNLSHKSGVTFLIRNMCRFLR